MARKTSFLDVLLGGKPRRSRKGFFGSLLAAQKASERRNGSHRGVMSGPGGSKKKR